MTDTQTSGAPGGNTPAPSNNTGNTGNTGGGFVRDRVAQMQTQRPTMLAQDPARPEDNRAAPDVRQPPQQPPPAEQKIRVGDGEFTQQELSDAMAAKAEDAIRKNTLPKTAAEYLAKNSASFKLPENIKFEFNEADPMLARARGVAMKHGLSQEAFSDLLDTFVAGQVNSLTNQATMRQRNLDALGAAGPQRIDAVATWLNARAGKDGAEVAAFIKQWPSAPIVRAFENVIRQFSNQGGVNFDQRGRVAQETTEGKIAGYDNMSFTQRRVEQMKQNMSRPGYRGSNER